MKKQKFTLCFILALVATALFANKTPNYPKGFSPKTMAGISFTENKGQIHDQNYKFRPDVLFSGTDGNLTFHLKNNGISYQLFRVDTWKKESDLSTKKAGFENAEPETKLVSDQTTIYRLDINWLNANTDAEATKQSPLDGFNNYYLQNCPNGALNVKSYQQITYQNIYDGIDLKWYEKNGHLEYDYLVSAGADYKQIQLEIKGADKIILNNKGELIYKTPLGDIIEQAPLVKQNGKILKSNWIIKNNILSFEIENINKSQAFIIDPVVRLWGTYYGGSLGESGLSCATDATGNVYLSGNTLSGSSIATSGSHQSAIGGSGDAFLVNFNSAGIRQWGTYYGGSSGESEYSCAIDNSGNVYMAGITFSSIGSFIATLGSHQSNFGGGVEAFLVKFNSAGIRQWGTYYGGIGDDWGSSCATDATGNVYLAGWSNSNVGNAIATLGSHQSSKAGSSDDDAFLVKFNSAGVRQWGTYYGGNAEDYAKSCATDAFGNVYLTGSTDDYGIVGAISTPGSHQSINAGNGGGFDAFLVKFNSAGVRQWGTYYGGNANDNGNFCTSDATGDVYLAGQTSSPLTAISTTGSHQSTYGGGTNDAFLVKFNSAGVRQWGTYYGGNDGDNGNFCATDATGNVYFSGSTSSSVTAISTIGSHQSTYGGNGDAFLVKFNSSGVRQWGTYYGGVGGDNGNSCATDATGNVYLVGTTNSSLTAIATLGSHQSTYGGGTNDAFLVKFNECTPPTLTASTSNSLICVGNSAVLSASSSVTSFTWNTGATTMSISVSPAVTSIYTVSVSDASACVASTTVMVTVDACTGIDEVIGNSILIYPNPNNGLFTIELNETTQVIITNVLGHVLLNSTFDAGMQIFDIKNNVNGIYFVQLNQNGKQRTIKLIKE